MDTIIPIIVLVFSIVELRNGILIVFKNQNQLILFAQISFLIFGALQLKEKTKTKLLENYKMNIKKIGWYTILGNIPLILISVNALFS